MNERGTQPLLDVAEQAKVAARNWGGSVGAVPTPDGETAPPQSAKIGLERRRDNPSLMCANGFAASPKARHVAGRTLPNGFPSPRLAQRPEGQPDLRPPEYASTAHSGGETAGHRRRERRFFWCRVDIWQSGYTATEKLAPNRVLLMQGRPRKEEYCRALGAPQVAA